jgi:hypothetical protein
MNSATIGWTAPVSTPANDTKVYYSRIRILHLLLLPFGATKLYNLFYISAPLSLRPDSNYGMGKICVQFYG